MDIETVARYAPLGVALLALVLLVVAVIKNNLLKRDYKELHESHEDLTTRYLTMSALPVNRLLTLADKEVLEVLANQMTQAIDGSVFILGQDDPYVEWVEWPRPTITMTFCDEETLEGFIVTATLAMERCRFEERAEPVEEPVAEGATA